jgi:hypothetical protein
MNKILILMVALFASSMLSCSSCGKSKDVPDAQVADSGPEASIIAEIVINKDNWELVLPATWTESKIDKLDVQFVASSAETTNLLVVTKSLYTGTYDQFIIETLRSLRTKGLNVLGVASETVNGQTFVLITTIKNDIVMLMWNTVKDGKAYSLSCGGPQNNLQENISGYIPECQKIADTFKIY